MSGCLAKLYFKLAELLVIIGASLSEPHTGGSRWTFDRHVTENLQKKTESPTLAVVDGHSTVT